jgi:MFS family permease
MNVFVNTLKTLRGNFSPLRYPNFRLYLGGQAISLIGTFLQATAQSWVVWELTRSESALSIVTMLNSLPILLFGAYAGVWIDRIDRRRLLIGAQVVAMILAFILAFLTQTNLVQIWHVYVLAFILGIVNALDMPAQQAFLGDLTGMADVRKAVNLNVTIIQVSRILGPAFAGIVVARLGVAPAFWLNGLSFIAVIISLMLVRANQNSSKSSSSVNPFRQIAEGFAYLRTNQRMQDLYWFAIILTFFMFSIIMNVLPAVADKLLHGNSETLGLLLASSGAGALVGVLFVVPITQTFRRSGIVMLFGLFWLSLWVSIFAHAHVLGLSMFAMFMGSIGAPTVMTMALGLVQLMSPPDMRGRLISLFTMISFGLQPVAALWIGFMAEDRVLGVENAIQVNALLLSVGALLMLAFRRELVSFDYNAAAYVRKPTDEPKSGMTETITVVKAAELIH